MDFASLKRASSSNSLERLNEELNKLSTKGGKKDDRFWEPTVDKAGNGYAIIRFMPAGAADAVDGVPGSPWARLWDHGFQGPSGLWYIENSLTTLNQKDPAAEMNSALWNTGLDSDKEIARKRKRRLYFISNIFVLKDPGNVENEGKVFLYRYGKKIFDKAAEAMNPPAEFQDEKPMNPFDMWQGANFALKIRKVEGYRNYDKSQFMTPGPLTDDAALEKIYAKLHALKPFLAPENFKTYAQLKARLEQVLTAPGSNSRAADLDEAPAPQERSRPVAETPATQPAEQPTGVEGGDDADLDYFQRLARQQ
jgi:hypothetical protein